VVVAFVVRLIASHAAYLEKTRILQKHLDSDPMGILVALNNHERAIDITTIVVMSGLTAFSIWYIFFRENKPQAFGSVDDEGKTGGWFGNMFTNTFKTPSRHTGMSLEQGLETIPKNIVSLTYETSAGTRRVRGFMVKTGYILTNAHLFTNTGDVGGDFLSGDLTIERHCVVGEKVSRNKTVVRSLHSKHIAFHASKDQAMLRIDSVFQVRDRTNLFVDDTIVGKSAAKLLFTEEGVSSYLPVITKQDEQGYARKGKTDHSEKCLSYNSTQTFRVGDCGMLLMTCSRSPIIHGIHFAGLDGFGVSTIVTASDVTSYYRSLGSLVVQADMIDPQSFGVVKIEKPGVVNPKAKLMVEYDDGTQLANMEILGSTKVRRSHRTEIRDSVIRKDVEEAFDHEDPFGPPLMKGVEADGTSFDNWKAFNTSLEKLARGACDIPERDKDRAVMCYKQPLIEVARQHGVHNVLTLHQAINGVHGKKFLDALKFNTSTAFPQYTLKSHYFTLDENGQRVPSPELLEEIQAVLARYKKGLKCGFMMTAMLKDEPVDRNRFKVRVFYAGPMVLTILVRMYFLPIVRFLQTHTAQSEIAVGINCMSEEWQLLMDHMEKFVTEDDEALGYDFKGYDLAQPNNGLRAAYHIMIEIARAGGYSEEDLGVMEVMVEDLINPLIDWNGTCIQTRTVGVSGHPLTVITNSILNCLLVRSYFYSLNLDKKFTDCVANGTYGDDGKQSVEKTVRAHYNFVGFKSYLNNIGMNITHPSKTNTGRFVNSELDFLKRKSVFHPLLGYNVGALEKTSIFKGLCNVKPGRGGMTEIETLAATMDSALHELAGHGESEYDNAVKKLRPICEKYGIVTSTIEKTYEERMYRLMSREYKEGTDRVAPLESWLDDEESDLPVLG
jgi:hypothetical protein